MPCKKYSKLTLTVGLPNGALQRVKGAQNILRGVPYNFSKGNIRTAKHIRAHTKPHKTQSQPTILQRRKNIVITTSHISCKLQT